MAEESGVPYQSLINLYLRDCLANSRKAAPSDGRTPASKSKQFPF